MQAWWCISPAATCSVLVAVFAPFSALDIIIDEEHEQFPTDQLRYVPVAAIVGRCMPVQLLWVQPRLQWNYYNAQQGRGLVGNKRYKDIITVVDVSLQESIVGAFSCLGGIRDFRGGNRQVRAHGKIANGRWVIPSFTMCRDCHKNSVFSPLHHGVPDRCPLLQHGHRY